MRQGPASQTRCEIAAEGGSVCSTSRIAIMCRLAPTQFAPRWQVVRGFAVQRTADSPLLGK